MTLSSGEIEKLEAAINEYDFPAIYFDFDNGTGKLARNMAEIENVIADQLRSREIERTKHGLINILYWGYARDGRRNDKISRFLNATTDQHINNFQALVKDGNIPSIMDIYDLKMPQYSGMSFISKILMFLDPKNYCVLDRKISKLRTHGSLKSLNSLVFSPPREARIRITHHNEAVYNKWRKECAAISQEYFQNKYRVVDIERGFFNLIQQNLLDARAIYNNA